MASGNDQGLSGAGEPNDLTNESTGNTFQRLAAAISADENARRQPQNLQGVLRYSIEAGSAQSLPCNSMQPMDAERRSFLEATLRSMQGNNPVERMSRCVEVIHSNDNNENDIASSVEALEQIIDLVDNIDNAIDFHKIGGFRILSSCLSSPHSVIRSKTASLIAELSQNNPYIQSKILETDLLSSLISLMSDQESSVQVSALYAVSCVVRGETGALERFSELNGWATLLKAMTSSHEKLQLKSAFLLSSLCSLQPDIVDNLCRLNYVEQLCGLLSVSTNPLLEHLLRALVTMVTCSKKAAAICLEAQLQLDVSLARIIETVEKDSDEFLFAQQLKVAVFGGRVEDDGER